ncbi:MAG: NAD-dependent epimerase/dehydratase family protein [Thermodesulfobacteriota bacterium]
MRIAVVGGTGVIGRQLIDAVQRLGHEGVALSRSRGVDVLRADGLERALAGVHAVVDVSNMVGRDLDETRRLFATATRNLLAAEETAGVRHHVLLSIVGLERIPGSAHYAGKLAQEALVLSGPVPFSIQRATQFHEFAEQVVGWTRQGDVATLPPLLVQPVAASDVAETLAALAAGEPQGHATDLAGPEPQDLVDMARRTLAVRGERVRLVPSWRTGVLGVEAAGEVLLAPPGARLAPTTFDAWLERQGTARRSA